MRHLSRHAPRNTQPLAGRAGKFNLVSTLPVFCNGHSARRIGPESVAIDPEEEGDLDPGPGRLAEPDQVPAGIPVEQSPASDEVEETPPAA